MSNYDVAIIGAGVVGAAIARKLAAYELRVALLEKEVDAAFGVSKANSGIVHAGFHHPTHMLKTRLEIQGNLMYERLQHELGFPFKRIGIIVAAFSEEEMGVVEQLYRQGRKNRVPGLELCGRDRILAIEPKLNGDVTGGLFAPTGGVVEPYRMVFALVENATANGVDFITSFEVENTENIDDKYLIKAADGRSITAKFAINAAGLFADKVSGAFNAEEFSITPRKGEEFLLGRGVEGLPERVIFPVPAPNSKGILLIPTVEGTMMVGPTAEKTENKQDLGTTGENLNRVFDSASRMVQGLSRTQIITSFSGLRPTMSGDDFYIDKSQKSPRLIQVAGIQSPGLTAAPAIAEYVKDLLNKSGLNLLEKKNFDPIVAPVKAVRHMELDDINELSWKKPSYANIICQCEKVSEAEIVEAIHKGHTTLDGIKLYTRAGMGNCQGGFCTYRILKIISRETGLPVEKITRRGHGGNIVKESLWHV